MKIAVGSDHAGYELKSFLKEQDTFKDIEWKDFGTKDSESVDYPDFAHPVAQAVEAGEVDLGLIICGSGNGVAMAANKHQGVRAAIAWNETLAELARQHNNANILSLPSRFISKEEAIDIFKAFLSSTFEGGRHARRVGKISC